jgi:copper ion binding protein
MKTVTYQVPNISCGHCVHTIETEVGELEGVLKVNADQDSKMVEIEFQPPTDEDAIIALLAEINYPVGN